MSTNASTLKNNLEEAVDIFDNYMVTPEEDDKLTKERRKATHVQDHRRTDLRSLKLLSLGFTLLPVYCFAMISVGGFVNDKGIYMNYMNKRCINVLFHL